LIERYCTPGISAIWSPESRVQTWVEVELAITQACEKHGLVPPGTTDAIRKRAKFDLERIAELEKETKHDLMAFVRNLEENVGKEGRYIHFGVTSYDVIDTANALLIRRSIRQVLSSLHDLKNEIRRLAKEYADIPMIGRTHGVHAEPITFGFKLANWFAELNRSEERLRFAEKELSVGKVSGAVGVHGILGPEIEKEVCRILELEPDPASTQIVSRDRYASLFCALGILAGSLEKFATELRNLQRTEILEVQEEFATRQTGSSAMPHKRNPWHSETICGLARVVRGNVFAMLECISTWHERDLTNSSVERIILPDTFHLSDFMLLRLKEILSGLRVFPEKMRKNLNLLGDLVFSEHVMIALIRKGMSREEAYRVVQRNAAKAWEGEDFRKCIESDSEVNSLLSSEEIAVCFDLNHHLRHVEHTLRAVGIFD